MLARDRVELGAVQRRGPGRVRQQWLHRHDVEERIGFEWPEGHYETLGGFLVATLGLEAGWQQGTAPVSGFDDLQSDFNPKDGTWFASLGMRLAL